MVALDRYKTTRFEALQKEYLHTNNRRRQITLAVVLSVAFDEFHQARVNSVCANAKTTYLEAEQAADFFGNMFDMEVPIDAFLPSEKRVDAAIDHYQKYAEHRKIIEMFGYKQDDMDAFFKQIEHGAWKMGLTTFLMFNSIGYEYAIRAVYDYIEGTISLEQMQKGLVVFYPPELRPMSKAHLFAFSKTMFRLVREFEELVEKRQKRAENKNNVNANNLMKKILEEQ